MPLVVAEYWLKRVLKHEAQLSNWWQYELPGTTSLAEVLTGSPEELMTKYFASTQVSGDELQPIRWNILGTVLDGEDAAMVVYKPEGGKRRAADGKVRELVAWPRMLRVEREGDSWRIEDPSAAALHGSAWPLPRTLEGQVRCTAHNIALPRQALRAFRPAGTRLTSLRTCVLSSASPSFANPDTLSAMSSPTGLHCQER